MVGRASRPTSLCMGKSQKNHQNHKNLSYQMARLCLKSANPSKSLRYDSLNRQILFSLFVENVGFVHVKMEFQHIARLRRMIGRDT